MRRRLVIQSQPTGSLAPHCASTRVLECPVRWPAAAFARRGCLILTGRRLHPGQSCNINVLLDYVLYKTPQLSCSTHEGVWKLVSSRVTRKEASVDVGGKLGRIPCSDHYAVMAEFSFQTPTSSGSDEGTTALHCTCTPRLQNVVLRQRHEPSATTTVPCAGVVRDAKQCFQAGLSEAVGRQRFHLAVGFVVLLMSSVMLSWLVGRLSPGVAVAGVMSALVLAAAVTVGVVLALRMHDGHFALVVIGTVLACAAAVVVPTLLVAGWYGLAVMLAAQGLPLGVILSSLAVFSDAAEINGLKNALANLRVLLLRAR